MNITLPWPPSINGYWRSIPRGNCCTQIISRKGREYRDKVAGRVLQQKVPKMSGRLSVNLILRPATRREFDIDNFAKAALDAMEAAGVYDNDSQIDRLLIERAGTVKGGAVDVYITERRP